MKTVLNLFSFKIERVSDEQAAKLTKKFHAYVPKWVMKHLCRIETKKDHFLVFSPKHSIKISCDTEFIQRKFVDSIDESFNKNGDRTFDLM